MSEFAQHNPAPSIPPTQTPDAKILSDLAIVIEKINLCTDMLRPLTSSSEVDRDESLLAVIGFLEACVPRVRELVEAGMTGALAEDTVVKCLTVNDSLCNVLELVEHPENCEPAPEQKASASNVLESFDAFGITDDDDTLDKKPVASSSTGTSKVATSALEDLLMTPNTVPSNNTATATATAKAASLDEKEFDDFFNDRVGE